MKTSLIMILLGGVLLTSSCDQPTYTSGGGVANNDFSTWMRTLTKVKVTYSGSTKLQSFLKQGVRDPGNNSDTWLPREIEFSNRDSGFSIKWSDSTFESKCCFVFRQIDPSYTVSSDCSSTSLIRGTYRSGSDKLTGINCMFSSYHGGSDPNNYREVDASLIAAELNLESYGEDSISFAMKDWKAGSVSLGYNYDERAYATFIRQMIFAGYDTLGTPRANICRMVFYAK